MRKEGISKVKSTEEERGHVYIILQSSTTKTLRCQLPHTHTWLFQILLKRNGSVGRRAINESLAALSELLWQKGLKPLTNHKALHGDEIIAKIVLVFSVSRRMANVVVL